MNPPWPAHNKSRLWLAVAVGSILLALGLYLLVSQAKIGLGFPLDDAWIHQTYARNLGATGEWAFLPGQKSAGSTGPLWSGMVSIAYALGIPYKAWTYVLGSLALLATAYVAGLWFAHRLPERANWRWLAMAAIGLEWHLLWSALSGMETAAIAMVNVAVLYSIERNGHLKPGVGFLIGVGFWLRPEAVLLLLPVAWVTLLDFNISPSKRLLRLAVVIGAFLAVVTPYIVMNDLLVGEIWPTTFFAKQAEYAFLRQEPLISRLFQQAIQPLTGVGVVLVPGMILEIIWQCRQKRWAKLAPLVWAAAFLGSYALRLPVSYQHGRYAMPVIPVLLLMGLIGMARWLRFQSKDRLVWMGTRVWASVLMIVLLAFVGIGANAYATDVGVIETEMVAASHWIEENTAPDALIAAHDIGALGYFGGRQILDLAGLISPEVIPILWDEPELTNLLNNQQADYLMTFPGWYPEMTRSLPVVFASEGTFSPLIDGENMTIYAWPGE